MGHAPPRPRYSHKPPPGRPDRLSPTRGYYYPPSEPSCDGAERYRRHQAHRLGVFLGGLVAVALGVFLGGEVLAILGGTVAVCALLSPPSPTIVTAHRRRPRPPRSRWADEPPLEIEGLSEANVRSWYADAVKALMDDRLTAAEFETALDHLIARRGPLGSDGRPATVEGGYVPNGTGGFRPSDDRIARAESMRAAFAIPHGQLGRANAARASDLEVQRMFSPPLLTEEEVQREIARPDPDHLERTWT